MEINLESHIFFFSFHHGEPFKNTFNAIDFFKKIACKYETRLFITDPIPKLCSLCGRKENKTISYCEPCGESSIEYRPYTSVP